MEKRMKRNKSSQKLRKWLGYGLAGLAAFAVGIYLDLTESVLDENGQIPRAAVGGDDREVTLILDAGEVVKRQEYTLEVPAARIGEEEARACLEQARAEIDSSFWKTSEAADHVTGQVFPADSYVDGRVEAEWLFDDYDLISAAGILYDEKLSEAGTMIAARAELTCGDYSELYSFSFCGYPAVRSPAEELLAKIRENLQEQTMQEDNQALTLPRQVGDTSLQWSVPRKYYGIKILCMEGILLLLLWASELEKAEDARKKRQNLLEMEYSEVVSKLSILMGSGMSLRQAWNAIVYRYQQDRQKGSREVKPAIEEMLLTMREIQDGEQESAAYQKFGERCQIPCFWRLSRMLIQNQQKGSGGLCEQLTKEAESAFEQRILWARKKGEEAGTRMLAPLMFMMVIVIAIILVPAVIQFSTI